MSAVAPELVAALDRTLPRLLPPGALTIAQVRAADALLAPEPERTARPVLLPRADGTALEVRVHAAPGEAAVLWIHGGGMFLGTAAADDPLCRMLHEALGVTVAAVDYRLAPEHRHPEPLDDCEHALAWLVERHPHVVVAGLSAGGGLALGLALRVRDRGGPALAAVHAYYPMIDDRPTASRARYGEVWDARLDALAWDAYLGGAPADAYAAPARAVDLSGLPPVVIDIGELDLFRSEDETFAARLAEAGVPVDARLVPGAVHALEIIAPDTPAARDIWQRRLAALHPTLTDWRTARAAQ